MFDRGSRWTITKSVVLSADSGVESSTANSAANPRKTGLWVPALKSKTIGGGRVYFCLVANNREGVKNSGGKKAGPLPAR